MTFILNVLADLVGSAIKFFTKKKVVDATAEEKKAFGVSIATMIRITGAFIMPLLFVIAPKHQDALGALAAIRPEMALILHAAYIMFMVALISLVSILMLRILTWLISGMDASEKEYLDKIGMRQSQAFTGVRVLFWVMVISAEAVCIIDTDVNVVFLIWEDVGNLFTMAGAIYIAYVVVATASAAYYFHLVCVAWESCKATYKRAQKIGGLRAFAKEVRENACIKASISDLLHGRYAFYIVSGQKTLITDSKARKMQAKDPVKFIREAKKCEKKGKK